MPTQPTQSVVALPLAPSVRRALLCAGLSSVLDLQGLSEADLMQSKVAGALTVYINQHLHKPQHCADVSNGPA